MIKSHYILFEGLPGAGKSTLINFLRVHNYRFSLLPDFGNPKDLSEDFHMDFSWIVDIESQKSRLSLRSRKKITLQERGFLSILACHYMLEHFHIENTYAKVLKEISRKVESNLLIVPETIVIVTIAPEQSRLHQPGTKLQMWRDINMLKVIQEYYISYSKRPLFGEKIIVVSWEMLRDTMINRWEKL